jgi:hypothetical protein
VGYEGGTYRADTGAGNQQTTIRNIWNGLYAGPRGWVDHNFSTANLLNGFPDCDGDLVFAGDNRMYYISGGAISGYIKRNGPFNGGTWNTVSPTYAADVPAHLQVKAKSGLVASPDGLMLLYIGEDDYLYGFSIIDDWRYHYFVFMQGDMIHDGLKVHGSLIFPRPTQVYYIAKDPRGLAFSQYIHGFQYYSRSGAPPAWHPVDPQNHAVTPLGWQAQAGGALTYDESRSVHRIYYSGRNDGLLYYLEVHTFDSYTYVEFSGNSSLRANHLQVAGNLAINNNKIYFIGNWTPDHSQKWVYCLEEEAPGAWRAASPTWSAVSAGYPISAQLISAAYSNVAVSPDGATVIYFGYDPGVQEVHVCVLHSDDGIAYSFKKITDVISYGTDAVALDKLQFRSNTDFFCASKPEWVTPGHSPLQATGGILRKRHYKLLGGNAVEYYYQNQ